MRRGWGLGGRGSSGGCRVAGRELLRVARQPHARGRASLTGCGAFHCTSQILLLFCSHFILFQALLATYTLFWANCVRNRYLVFVFLCRYLGFLATDPATGWRASVATRWPLSRELRGDISWDTSCLPSGHRLLGLLEERTPLPPPLPPGPGPRLHDL